MSAADHRPLRSGPRAWLHRFIAIADEPTDDDDLRLRKRVGVVAGYLTVLATLGLPAFGQGSLLSVVLGLGMSARSALNLALRHAADDSRATSPSSSWPVASSR